jgi:hypothetical protein
MQQSNQLLGTPATPTARAGSEFGSAAVSSSPNAHYEDQRRDIDSREFELELLAR